jgi:2-iminobutanoate/2-iminopropanoate deaminase
VLAGDWVFVSGKIGERGGALEHEIQTAIDAVEQELAASGASLDDVASVTAYLTSMDDYAAFNEIYARRFPAPYPARAVVGVSALPGGARVEIQAIARRP